MSDYEEAIHAAIAEEREVCAKTLDDMKTYQEEGADSALTRGARSIRARP